MLDNPFYGSQIYLPTAYEDSIKKFVKQSQAGRESNTKFSPFMRQIDFWYFCLLYAANKNIEPKPAPKEQYQITDGTIFTSEPYRIRHIQVIALSYYKDFKLLANHNEVIKMCNSLVASACPDVISILNDRESGDPIFNLLDIIEAS